MIHSHRGLTQKEALKRLGQYGSNELKKQNRVPTYMIFLRQFWNVMVAILGVAMLVSLVVGELLDSIAIGSILFLNAVIGFFQEYKAEKAIDSLKKLTAPMATVRREGKLEKIPARELVPGDIVILEEGSSIPADGILVLSAELQAMEAILTGESLPVEKSVKHKVFMGTIVTRGHGEMEVSSTGMKTELGSIAHMVQAETREDTPLQKEMNGLTKNLAKLVMGLLFLLFLLGLGTHRQPVEILLLSISLAVSVIPEGLPAIITLTLALGVERMAKRKAIIRRLSAAETLGSTSVICTDKTGTLTKNEMTIEKIMVNGEIHAIAGEGYAPLPTFHAKNKEMEKLILAGVLCNNAGLKKEGALWTVQGDPTEAAFLTLGEKMGVKKDSAEKKTPRKKELIFDSVRKMMSTAHGHILYSKGAPEEVLKRCNWIEEDGKKKLLDAHARKKIMDFQNGLAKEAYRVLAIAYKPYSHAKDATEDQLIFLGLVAMMDPPRPEVKAAIETCHNAHIQVIMITGDHATTARAIGEKIGLLGKKDGLITGDELEKMGHHELTRQLEHVRIFARVSPKHKVQILEALQQMGHIVAMTGDGVNDAPALKKANIGVAMGITGSDVAKDASDMILMDDNFATIVEAIREGRTIYRNIKKFIRFLLSANFNQVLTVTVIFALGDPIPFLPLQILYVNLLTDALPAIALGLDKSEADLMQLPPREAKKSIWRDLVKFSALAGVLATAISLTLFYINLHTTSLPYLRTLLMTSAVVFEMGLAFSIRFPDKHFFHGFFKNPLLLFSVALSLGLQFLATTSVPFQRILDTMALSGKDWGLIIGLCVLSWIVLELWKLMTPKSSTV